MYMTIRSWMSSIIDLIRRELSKLSALEFENFPYLTVYTLASANIDQSVPNLATIYMPIKSQMSLIMGQIELEHPELFALEFGKIAESDCLHSSIDKYWPINTKLGKYVCDHKILDVSDYGYNWTRTVQVICPWIRKFAIFDFVYTLASANIDQSVPNLATIYIPIKFQMSLVIGQI